MSFNSDAAVARALHGEKSGRGFQLHGALFSALLLAAACGEEPKGVTPAPPQTSPEGGSGEISVGASSVMAPVVQPSDGLKFRSLWDTKQEGDRILPMLRGGYVGDYRDWPASLYATFKGQDDRLRACTAVLLGPHVVLTAAHCVPPNGQIAFGFDGTDFAANCSRHPRYEANLDKSADYALCDVSGKKDVRPVTASNFAYETVNITAMSELLGKSIILSGFGCTSDTVGAGPSDGKYRFGSNVVVETSGSKPHKRDNSLYAGSEDNNLFTEESKPGEATANLCPGDSGGPAFLPTGDGDLAKRVVIGVNSRVFYSDASQSTYGASLVSALGTSTFEVWARGWLSASKREACGITTPITLSNCRH